MQRGQALLLRVEAHQAILNQGGVLFAECACVVLRS